MSRYQEIYRRWHRRHEATRKAIKAGLPVIPYLPTPPIDPTEISRMIGQLGEHRVSAEFGVSLRTLRRWATGDAVPSRPAALLLRCWADGRLPGMGDDWQPFIFRDDRLCVVGTNLSYTAREILGWHYRESLIRVQRQRITELEQQLSSLSLPSVGPSSANSPLFRLPRG